MVARGGGESVREKESDRAQNMKHTRVQKLSTHRHRTRRARVPHVFRMCSARDPHVFRTFGTQLGRHVTSL